METLDSRASRRPPRTLFAAALALAALSAACGPSEQPKTAPSAQQLPLYGPDAARLFDDTISPDVFGASIDGSDAAADPALPIRTQRAEAVVPVKVSTVTSDTEGGSPAYTLVLSPVGPPLSGRPWGQPINIEIWPTSPSFAFMHSADSTLVGREFILFFRHYNEQGQITVHWRAEADTPALRAAVERARLVGGFGS